MEFIFGGGSAVCEILIDKLVTYYRNDELAGVLEDIFNTAHPKLTMEFLKEMKKYSQ